MKSMHRAVCLIHVLGLNPMSVNAVQVKFESSLSTTALNDTFMPIV